MSTSYLFSVLRNFAFFLILTQESLDGNAFSNYNMKCCYGKYIRPWRSWISQQIPILKAGGSNPSGRTINAASVFTMFAAFYFFALAGAYIGKEVHDNSANRLDGFVNRRFDSSTLYIREFLISFGSYVILSMNERSVKLETNN